MFYKKKVLKLSVPKITKELCKNVKKVYNYMSLSTVMFSLYPKAWREANMFCWRAAALMNLLKDILYTDGKSWFIKAAVQKCKESIQLYVSIHSNVFFWSVPRTWMEANMFWWRTAAWQICSFRLNTRHCPHILTHFPQSPFLSPVLRSRPFCKRLERSLSSK